MHDTNPKLGADARRALAHIHARTVTGRFACRLYDMNESAWTAALAELRSAGYDIQWTLGTVADDPTLNGGYTLARRAGDTPTRLAQPPLTTALPAGPHAAGIAARVTGRRESDRGPER